MKGENNVKEQYDQLAEAYNLRWHDYVSSTLGFLKKWMNLQGTERILDVACGTGALEEPIVKEHPSQTMTGVDISENMLDVARRKPEAHQNVSFFRAGAANLPVADLKPTVAGSPITGKVSFMETEEGLKINAVVENAPPGRHGFHIHEKGDCSDQGNAAGGHFNPDNVPHGDVEKQGFSKAHAGDLGNIEIGSDGKGKLEKVIPGLTLKQGKYGVVGRSVILHEKEDNFGQPTGNAGGRIACAVITEP